MPKKKHMLVYAIIFFALIAAEAALITLYAASRFASLPTMADLYVAGIVICAILLVFILLTKLGPALLLKDAIKRLRSLTETGSRYESFDPDGFRDRLQGELQKEGYTIADTALARSNGEPLRVATAIKKTFSLFFDRMHRYVIITDCFKKARDFDTLSGYAQSLIEAEGLSDNTRARSGFSTVVVLLMPHVPEQVQAACRDEAATLGPAYIPVACDLSAGKAYYLSGKSLALLEYRAAQRIIRKHVLGKNK